MRSRVVLVLGIALLALGLASLCGLGADFVIKYAHAGPANADTEPPHGGAVAFKSYVETASGGRIRVDLYPGGQLGGEREIIEGVQFGDIEMGGSISDACTSTIFPMAQAWTIPYLFKNYAVAFEFGKSALMDELIEQMADEQGVRVLGITDIGFRSFTNNVRPIQGPEDLAGLKFRTMEGPAYIKLVEALDASATPIPIHEVYTSLQTGVVDGQENPPWVVRAFKFYEVQDYLTLDGHVYCYSFTVINEDFYQSLPEDLQRIVREGVEIAALIHRGMVLSINFSVLDFLKEEGMDIYQPTPAELNAFKDATGPAVLSWLRTVVDPDLVDRVLETVADIEEELGL